MEALQDLIKKDDIAFLKAIVSRYPETIHLIEDAEASPEGSQTINSNALSHKVFTTIVPINAIEAERTFLGLLLLKDVLNNDKKRFPYLSAESFKKLYKYTISKIKTNQDMEFCFYSLACNDLGKLKYFSDIYKDIYKKLEPDHDFLLAKLVTNHPHLFVGMNKFLTSKQINDYGLGLNANLNLGQFVQAENTPFCLAEIQKLKPKARDLRLCMELYDFAGGRGHIRNDLSLVMGENNFSFYMSAINELITKPLDKSYQRYILSRGKLLDIEDFALARIACMARVFIKRQAKELKKVFYNLPKTSQRTLIEELNITGLENKKAILIYYSPAFIANSIKANKSFEKGLKYALEKMVEIYIETNKKQNRAGNGNILINISELARKQLNSLV